MITLSIIVSVAAFLLIRQLWRDDLAAACARCRHPKLDHNVGTGPCWECLEHRFSTQHLCQRYED